MMAAAVTKNGLRLNVSSVDEPCISIIDVRRKLNYTCLHPIKLGCIAIGESDAPENHATERNQTVTKK